MLDVMTWRKNENFHKANFDRFQREVVVRATKVQNDQRTMPMQKRNVAKEITVIQRAVNTVRNRSSRSNTIHQYRQHVDEKPDRQKAKIIERGREREWYLYEPPFCLNPTFRAE